MIKNIDRTSNEEHQVTYPSRVVIECSDNAIEREAMQKYIYHILQNEDDILIEWMCHTSRTKECHDEKWMDFIKIASDGSVFWTNKDESNLKNIGHLNEDGQIILNEGISLI